MRLLELKSPNGEPCITADLARDELPTAYAILSHTWGADSVEVEFDEIKNPTAYNTYTGKVGYAKIRFCGQQAWKDGLRYFWVDTCCIDKKNFTELHTAINSMFGWYQGAVKCYVYLADVSMPEHEHEHEHEHEPVAQEVWESAFRESRWFKRGWTLQELIAPRSVEFFSREWRYLGNKDTLEQLIHEITKIPTSVLRGTSSLSDFSTEERFRWSVNRYTKREEDQAYCLLGIFNVFMSLIYGEGRDEAVQRLKRKIEKSYSACPNYNHNDLCI